MKGRIFPPGAERDELIRKARQAETAPHPPSGTATRDYRAYVIGPDGHIIDRFDFWCADDETAKERAKQYVNGYDVELWHRDKKIAGFKNKQ